MIWAEYIITLREAKKDLLEVSAIAINPLTGENGAKKYTFRPYTAEWTDWCKDPSQTKWERNGLYDPELQKLLDDASETTIGKVEVETLQSLWPIIPRLGNKSRLRLCVAINMHLNYSEAELSPPERRLLEERKESKLKFKCICISII
jgi:hypothetical protein